MLLGLLGLIIGSRSDLEWYRLLAGGYALTRASLSTIHAVIAGSIPRARQLCLVNAASGLLLSVAPAVLAWQATHEEAYRLHIAVMVVAAVGELACEGHLHPHACSETALLHRGAYRVAVCLVDMTAWPEALLSSYDMQDWGGDCSTSPALLIACMCACVHAACPQVRPPSLSFPPCSPPWTSPYTWST